MKNPQNQFKICTNCKLSKEVSDFHKDATKKDGLQNICKECRKLYKETYRKKFTEKIRTYDREYYANNKGRFSEYGQKYRKKNRFKKLAQSKLNSEVLKGNIKKPKVCSKCNENCKVEAHHYYYDKPLDVIWLCRECHVNLHKHLNGDD